MTKKRYLSVLFTLFLCFRASTATAQIVEAVGSRALGMGGAFVAVADDSSATWWNPAGLAAGPFLDLALARSVTRGGGDLPAGRERGTWIAVSTPPFGLSYYRLRMTQIQPPDPAAGGPVNRQDGGTGVPVRSLSVSQLGATFVHTLITGVHAGATVKYVRGTPRSSIEDPGLDVSDALDRVEALPGGDTDRRVDLDVGVLAVGGPFRVGGSIRNLREPVFGEARLPRQARVGAAFDADRAGWLPLTIALDADLRRYPSSTGHRRMVALGGEQWFAGRRLAVRAGARFNTLGARERVATAGISIAIRSALYADAHMVAGGAADERGWGTALRVSF